MVTLRQADYTEQMCQLKPSLFFFLTPEPFQLQPRISFRISKGWFPSPPANPNPSRPLGTQDALHAAESASSWIHGDPKEQTQATQSLPCSGACLEPSFHKQSHILSVRLNFSAPCFLKSSLLTIFIKVEMRSQSVVCSKVWAQPQNLQVPSLGEALPVLVTVTRLVAVMRSSAWKRPGAGCIAPDFPNWKPKAPD